MWLILLVNRSIVWHRKRSVTLAPILRKSESIDKSLINLGARWRLFWFQRLICGSDMMSGPFFSFRSSLLSSLFGSPALYDQYQSRTERDNTAKPVEPLPVLIAQALSRLQSRRHHMGTETGSQSGSLGTHNQSLSPHQQMDVPVPSL